MEDDELLRIYFDQIRSYPLLDSGAERALTALIADGDSNALHRLVRANLRLAVKIAMPYAAKDIPLMDLIQEGNMGLMRAAQKFDTSKNVRFSTYAGWWIRQYISRYLQKKHRIIRLPVGKETVLRKIQYAYHTLSQTLMHQPRAEDIAAELGISAQEVDSVVNMSAGPVPLELDYENSGYNAAMDIHEDYTYNPEQALFRNYHRDSTRIFLERLKDREKQVIFYRYRFYDGQNYTLKEIGVKMNLSPESVRQIEMRALAAIRSHADEIERYGLLEAM